MAELYLEDLRAIDPVPFDPESAAVTKMLAEYRMRLNAARHTAQEAIYNNPGNASPEDVERYTQVVTLMAELQQNVFTSDWRKPRIGLKGTTNHTQNDTNWVKYCFLVKMLGDQQIKVAPPYTREDIDDALQFCNNFRELLSMPYFCSSNLRIPAEPPVGKVMARVVAPVAQAVAVETKASKAVPTADFMSAYAASEGARERQVLVASIERSLREAGAASDKSWFQLLLNLSSADKLPEELVVSIDAAIKRPAVAEATYANARDYGKWLVQKARLKGGDDDVLREAGAWLLLADKRGAEKDNYGPILFDMHMRSAPETTKAAARLLFESWVKQPVDKK